MKKRKSGFTLIELMIVVAIIAILAALAISTMVRAQKKGPSPFPPLLEVSVVAIGNDGIQKINIEGHDYFLVQNSYGTTMTHSASCPMEK